MNISERVGRGRTSLTGHSAKLIALATVLLLPDAGLAQVGDRTTIDQRLRQVEPEQGLRIEADADSPLGSLVLLREREFFTLAVNGGVNYTSNAFLSDEDREGDFVLNLDISLRAETEIDERVQVLAELAAFGLRYADNDELNLYGLRGRLGAVLPVDGFDLGFTYSPTIAWDDSFDRRLVTLHPLTISLARQLPLSSTVLLLPGVSGGYTFSSPGDFSAWNVAAEISAIWVPSSTVSVFLTPRLTYRDYTDYFESLTDRARRDWNLGLGLTVNYTPAPGWLVQASLSGAINNSTVDALDYGAIDMGPQVQFSRRF